MAGSPMDRIEVSGVEVAQRAQQIAKQKGISFGEALFQARREIMFDDVQVQRNTGSPLRDQTTSSTPSAPQVRQAVVAGLNNCKNYLSQAGVLGMFAVNYSADMVQVEFEKLGLGPQVVSALKAELTRYLSSRLNASLSGTVLDSTQVNAAISDVGDHMQQVYTAALANKVDTQVWSEQQFSEAQNLSDGGHCAVSMDSMLLRDAAVKIQKQRGISFGEALTLARRGVTFADDVVDPQALKDQLSAFLQSSFGSLFQGAQQKIIQSTDVLQIADEARDALRPLNLGAAGQAVIKAIGDTLNSCTGKMSLSDVGSVIGKVVAAAQKAYSNAVSQS